MTEEQAVLQKMGQEHAAKVQQLEQRYQDLRSEYTRLEQEHQDNLRACVALSKAMRKLLKAVENGL